MSTLETIIEDLQQQIDELNKKVIDLQVAETYRYALLHMVDGVSSPSADSGWGIIYIDNADGDLKILFGNDIVKTIVTDT